MAQRSRTIRKVQTHQGADFDDQLWPINCALLILAGFVVGIVLATSDFDDSRILYNAAARLIGVAVTLGLLTASVMWLQGRMRRRLQLCVLISLLAHLALAFYLQRHYLALVAQWQAESQQQVVERYEPVTVPDYHWQHIEEPETRNEFQEPFETETPRPTEPETLERGANEPEMPTDTAVVDQPEIPQRQQPHPSLSRRTELSAPRRADEAAGAQITRQPWKHRPTPNEPIPEQQLKAPSRRTAAVVPSADVPPRRRPQTRVRIDQRETFEELSSTRQQQVEVNMARRATGDEPLKQTPTTPSPTRQVSRPAELPRAEAVTPEPIEVARRSRQAEPVRSPAMANVRRQAGEPNVVRQSAEAMPTTPQALASARAGQRRSEQNAPRQPEPRATPARRPAESMMPTAATSPRAESVATAAAASEPANLPTVRADSTAVSRASAGSMRFSDSQPAGRALPAMTDDAQLPLALAARRPAASQPEPGDAEATPAAPSTLVRSSRGANLPSTAIPTEDQPAASPAAAGATPTSRVRQLASSAAVRHSGAQPPSSRNVAAAGSAELALGSSQIVARIGQPRATGAGRPSSTADAPTRRLARTADAVAPSVSVSGAPEAAVVAPGAAVSDDSRQSVPVINAQASAAQRGGTVRNPAEQSTASGGPAGSAGASEAIGVAASRRVTRRESIDSAMAGGGAPRPSRTLGGSATPNRSADTPTPTAVAAPRGGSATQAPLVAQFNGPRRELSGLPGSLRSQPSAGALASLTREGAPWAGAVARRAAASQQEPGEREIGAAETVTMMRSRAGTDLPAVAVPAEEVPNVGTAGVATTQGGLPSILAKGPHATIRRAAAPVPVAQASVASSAAESGIGSAQSIAMAGRLRAGGEKVPALTPGTAARSIRRSSAGAPRRAAALPDVPVDSTAAEAAGPSGPAATTPGIVAGRRRTAQGDRPGPSVAAEVGRGPLRRTDVAGLPRGVAEPIEEQPVAAVAAVEPGDAIEMADGTGMDEPSRQEGGLPVQIAAVAGPGGLSYDPSPEVGLPSHRARPESDVVHTVVRRFILERSGGRLAIDGRIRRQPTEAFRQRDRHRRAEAVQAGGGSEGTEKAVEMGLDFFARHQFPDGHWSLHELPEGVQHEDAALGQMKSDSAATGLALLSYLGAGYTHLDDKHRAVVQRGIDWLVRNQKADGDLFAGGTKYAWFYSHGIAAIAICEAYGMTRDPELRQPARKAIDFIVQTQHPTRGGWRYYLNQNGLSIETDTSVTGWQLMALKSAQMAGLEIPDGVLDRVDRWLDGARGASRDGRYVYNPYAGETPQQRSGREPSLAMTSEAMLMRIYLGHAGDDPQLIAGADYIKHHLPEVGTEQEPLRDCYYWYYATQAMFQMQGEYWTAWNDRLRPLLTGDQVQFGALAGSWHPLRPVADRWGRAGGRHYVTAMHLLMLEVYYRHLPLFQELGN